MRALYEASPSSDKRLEIVDGGGHGTQLFDESDSGQQLQDDVLDFVVAAFS